MPVSNLLNLREGGLVAWHGDNWRILHCEDFGRVLATRASDGHHEFLPIRELSPVASVSENADSGRRIRQTIGTSNKARDAAAKALEEFHFALRILNTPRAMRRRLVRDMANRFNYNEATAYRRIAIVRVHGDARALLHAVRPEAGKRKLADQAIEIIRAHLKEHRYIAEPKTLPNILELVNGTLRKEDLTEVSLSTLRSFERETTLKKKLEAQGRKKAAADAFRPKVGHLPNNDYPLAIVQIDHTPVQLCFVDEEDRQPIGDAWLTLVIDTYSRMVLGFFLSFDPPSALSAGMALAHAILPKDEFLRSVGVHGEWPCWGIPDVIHVDNATELNGRMMHSARQRYRFTLRDRPVGSPNFGGHVESAFKTFMYEFKSLPGTKFSNPMERGEYDSEGRAIFTIREFEALFTEFLVNDYHLREHGGDGMDGMVPLMKWKRGIFEGDKMPPTGLPPIPTDPLALRISLMPLEYRTVRNCKVDLLANEYHSGQLALLSDKIDLTKPKEARQFEVRYDPRNISRTWLYDEGNQTYIEIGFSNLAKGPVSLWEDRARRRRRPAQGDDFKDERYESKLRREEMKETAAKRTKQRRLEAEKAKRRSATAIVQPAPPKATAAPGKKKQLDPARLQAMRDRVRAAGVPMEVRKESDHES